MAQPWYYYAPYHDLAVGHPPRAAVLPQHFLFANASDPAEGLGTVSGPVASMLLQALSRAVQRDDLPLLQRLLLLGAQLDGGAGWFLPALLDGVDALGCTLLQRTCVLAAGSADHMKTFAGGASSAKGGGMDASGEPYLDILMLLLQAGASVNARDIRGATALHYASVAGNLPMTQLLLRAGASPHLLTDDGSSALLLALESGAEDVARVLLPCTNKAPPQDAEVGGRSKKRSRKRRKRRGDEAAAARLFMQPPAPAARLSSLLFHAVGNGDLLFSVYLSSLVSVPSAMQRPHPSWWCAAASRSDQLLGMLLGGSRASSRMLPLALLSPSGLDSEARKAVDVAVAALRHATSSAGAGGHGGGADNVTPWGLSETDLDSVRACLEGAVQPIAAAPMRLLTPKAPGSKGATEAPVRGVLTNTTLFLVPVSGSGSSQEVSLDVVTQLTLGWPEPVKPKLLSKTPPAPLSAAVDAGVPSWDPRHSGPLAHAFTWQSVQGTLNRVPSLPGVQSTPRTAMALALGAALGDRGAARRAGGASQQDSLWVTHMGAQALNGQVPLHATSAVGGVPPSQLGVGRLLPPAAADKEGGKAKGGKKGGNGGSSGTHVVALHVSVGNPVLLAFDSAAVAAQWLRLLAALCLQRSEAADSRSAVTRGGRWLHGATFTLRAHVSKQREARKQWLRRLAGDAVRSALACRDRAAKKLAAGGSADISDSGKPPPLTATAQRTVAGGGSAGEQAPREGSGGDGGGGGSGFTAYKLAVPCASSAGLGLGTAAKPAPIFSIAEGEGGEEEDSDSSAGGSVSSFHAGDSPRSGGANGKVGRKQRKPPGPPPKKRTPPSPPGGAAASAPPDSKSGSKMRLSIRQRPPAPGRQSTGSDAAVSPANTETGSTPCANSGGATPARSPPPGKKVEPQTTTPSTTSGSATSGTLQRVSTTGSRSSPPPTTAARSSTAGTDLEGSTASGGGDRAVSPTASAVEDILGNMPTGVVGAVEIDPVRRVSGAHMRPRHSSSLEAALSGVDKRKGKDTKALLPWQSNKSATAQNVADRQLQALLAKRRGSAAAGEKNKGGAARSAVRSTKRERRGVGAQAAEQRSLVSVASQLQAVARGWRVRAALRRGAWVRVQDEDGDVFWWSSTFEVSSWQPPPLDSDFDYFLGKPKAPSGN